MEWLFLLIAYLPIISILIGFGLLVPGFASRKAQKQSKGLLIAGSVCFGACLLIYASLFLIGALGFGPVPN